MVPDINVTVLAFKAFLVSTDPNWNIAFRLSLTFAGSNSVSSARAAKPQAIIMATIASPSTRCIVFLVREKLILHLAEALLRIHRTVPRRLLVPFARQRRIGSDASH